MTSSSQLRPAHCPTVRTTEIAQRISARHQGAEVQVSGITNRSAEVRAGDLFVGVPGSRAHGARFAADAVAAGAVAVLTDQAGLEVAGPLEIPVLVVDDVREVIGAAAAQVYGDPSQALKLLGITGTSGKTTTAYLLRAILDAAGIRSGLLGTVETLIADERFEHTPGASFTTPEAPDLQALLAVMVERSVTHVVMEVSSHALQLGRVGGIEFAVAGFNNLSQDHLDFHHTMEEYFQAKAALFDGRAAVHVLNVDDPYGARLTEQPQRTVTLSPSGAAADWSVRPGRVPGAFTLLGPESITLNVNLSLPGAFNVANAAMAVAMAAEIDVDAELAAAALAEVRVPGRMERIEAGQDYLAVVDYSHKPAAVQAALQSVRQQARGRVLIVLGCGGDRDAAKRPIMGEVAARGADLLVITDDNPRSEDPATIRAEMLRGANSVDASERAQILEVSDRAAAIRAAVERARADDVVLVAGKGHETGQYVGTEVHPFDDRAQLRAAIVERTS
ncbi:MAG: UDP-N-acetylmuramoyl-L-alanyl-D-glutamate--2,6-diaminopimelate ligase [Cumulibacter sp.]